MGSKTGRREAQSGGPPLGNRSHRCWVPVWPGGLEQAERRENGLRTETGFISIKRGLVVGKEFCEEGQREWSECSVTFQTAGPMVTAFCFGLRTLPPDYSTVSMVLITSLRLSKAYRWPRQYQAPSRLVQSNSLLGSGFEARKTLGRRWGKDTGLIIFNGSGYFNGICLLASLLYSFDFKTLCTYLTV